MGTPSSRHNGELPADGDGLLAFGNLVELLSSTYLNLIF